MREAQSYIKKQKKQINYTELGGVSSLNWRGVYTHPRGGVIISLTRNKTQIWSQL